MAESTPEDRRNQRIADAKRRVAEKRGETYVPTAEEADGPSSGVTSSSQAEVPKSEEVAPLATEPEVMAEDGEANSDNFEEDSAEEASGVAESAAVVASEMPAQAAEVKAEVAKPATAPPTMQNSSTVKKSEEPGEESKFLRTDIRTLNRREFLTYSWGAAAGIVTAQSLVATGLLMYPRFRAGEFGGDFSLGSVASLPGTGVAPQGDPIGKFWLVNTEEGPRALYMVCTHLGCLYKWVEANERFECPCHGSKFTREGQYIEGPAPRGLDQFVVELLDNGAVIGSTESRDGKIQPPTADTESLEIVIKTGSKIQGKSHS